MQTADLYKLFKQYPQIETDTRKVKKGDLFFALKGPNFNGNHYVQQALDAGASYCITDEPTITNHPSIILVEDSLTALQNLAALHRKQFDIPFIAITGSNGKTTTKELVHEVLSTHFRCYTTKGNLNNHIGIPLTILRIKEDAEIAVIEMGANHQKEIEGYCLYAMPTHGNITNCGKAHLEGFGGIEGVKKGKAELMKYLASTGGSAFVNTDYDYAQELIIGVSNIITYGTKNADFVGHVTNDSTFLEVTIDLGANIPLIQTHLVGGYNLPNILTAVAIGKTFGVPDSLILKALEQYQPSNSRSQLIEKNGNQIILDAYNANPTSMKAAIENFAQMEGVHKILMLGSMMELGEESELEHNGIIAIIQKYNWDKVVVTGNGYTQIPDNFLHFENSAEAGEWFKLQNFNGKQILIKGSRSMQMEKILD